MRTEPGEEGRWIAEMAGIPGVLCYGANADDAMRRCADLYRKWLIDRGQSPDVLLLACRKP